MPRLCIIDKTARLTTSFPRAWVIELADIQDFDCGVHPGTRGVVRSRRGIALQLHAKMAMRWWSRLYEQCNVVERVREHVRQGQTWYRGVRAVKFNPAIGLQTPHDIIERLLFEVQRGSSPSTVLPCQRRYIPTVQHSGLGSDRGTRSWPRAHSVIGTTCHLFARRLHGSVVLRRSSRRLPCVLGLMHPVEGR